MRPPGNTPGLCGTSVCLSSSLSLRLQPKTGSCVEQNSQEHYEMKIELPQESGMLPDLPLIVWDRSMAPVISTETCSLRNSVLRQFKVTETFEWMQMSVTERTKNVLSFWNCLPGRRTVMVGFERRIRYSTHTPTQPLACRHRWQSRNLFLHITSQSLVSRCQIKENRNK